MKRYGLKASLLAITLLFSFQSIQAQSAQLLGGNLINGTLTGTLLGAASLGLNNSSDFETPMRLGVGFGILGGAAIAVYDIVSTPAGDQFLISATFNDGNNTSIILLLDTVYGAAGGAFLGTAFMLIANKPLVKGLQYGSSAGAWVGFGFGILDAFVLADRNSDFISSNILNNNSIYQASSGNSTFSFGAPMIVPTTVVQGSSVLRDFRPALGIINYSLKF
jgi:hypothetical protein